MGTFILVFFIMILLVAGMSVGVIFGRKPISGTCGGIGALGISSSCELCGGNNQKCEETASALMARQVAVWATMPIALKAEQKQTITYNFDPDKELLRVCPNSITT